MAMYDEARVRRFFEIEEEDVAANRAGRLGRRQRRGYGSSLVIWVVLLVVWLGAMGFAVAIQLDGDSWHGAGNLIATIVFVVLVAAFPAYLVGRLLPFLSRGLVVATVTGPVSVGDGFLTVAGRRLMIPRTYDGRGGRRPQLAPWLDPALTYDVFAARGRAIGLVPRPAGMTPHGVL